MMKLLLISPNIEFLPDPIFPLGLAYIAAALKRRGIDHRILDLCFVADVEAELAAEIASYRPDLIGLSLRNLDNVSYPKYTSYLPFYREGDRHHTTPYRQPHHPGWERFFPDAE